MYAEAVLRGGNGGSYDQALKYVNALRERAYGNSDGDLKQSQLSLDYIINERARELYLESERRTDLIRFGEFTTSKYLWQWKGGTKDGMAETTSIISTQYQIPNSPLIQIYTTRTINTAIK